MGYTREKRRKTLNKCFYLLYKLRFVLLSHEIDTNFQEFLWKRGCKTKVLFKGDENSSKSNTSNSLLKNYLLRVPKPSFA